MNKLNNPSNISAKLKTDENLNELKNYGLDKETLNDFKWDSEYKLKHRLSARQRIIDSLNIPLNKLMIIDYFSHGTSGEFEMNYFFYDSVFIRRSFNIARTPMEDISSGNIMDIKQKNSNEKMLYEIYEAFYINYPNIPKDFKREDDGKTFYSYEVTISKDNKVNFYKISNNENFIVYQLRGKKLLPL